jgi:hypothetical protein
MMFCPGCGDEIEIDYSSHLVLHYCPISREVYEFHIYRHITTWLLANIIGGTVLKVVEKKLEEME